MTNSRQLFLIKVAVAVVGLFLLDRFVFTPIAECWKDQSERISDLREKVQRGRQLIERQDQIRSRWAEMLRTNLPSDHSAAQDQAIKAVSHWEAASRVTLSSLTDQWQNHDDGSETFECRVSADGTQASLGRFIYEMEIDPLPVTLAECELAIHDASGSKLTLTARFTFLRLAARGSGR